MKQPAVAVLALVLLGGCAAGRESLPDAKLPAQVRGQPDRYVLATYRNPVQPLPSRGGSTLRGYDTVGGYLVGRAALTTAAAVASEHGLAAVAAWPIEPLQVYCVLYRIAEQDSRDGVLARLGADPRVQLAQPLQTFATSGTAYNDRYLELQRGFDQLSVAAAHEWSQGAGVRVALVDTGVDATHPDLAGRVRSNRDFAPAVHGPQQGERHGTQMAGIIAAVGNNGQGIVGIAPQVALLAYRACWQLRDGESTAECNSYTLAQALAAAIDSHADVINLSLVGPADPLLALLATRAIARGAIVVGAVPSSGRLEGFPAGVPGVLAVEMTEDRSAAPDALRAPGSEILTLLPAGRYDFATGNSASTAMVSGVVALLRERAPAADATVARDLLLRSTRSVAAPADDYRAINACWALAELLDADHAPQKKACSSRK